MFLNNRSFRAKVVQAAAFGRRLLTPSASFSKTLECIQDWTGCPYTIGALLPVNVYPVKPLRLHEKDSYLK